MKRGGSKGKRITFQASFERDGFEGDRGGREEGGMNKKVERKDSELPRTSSISNNCRPTSRLSCGPTTGLPSHQNFRHGTRCFPFIPSSSSRTRVWTCTFVVMKASQVSMNVQSPNRTPPFFEFRIFLSNHSLSTHRIGSRLEDRVLDQYLQVY